MQYLTSPKGGRRVRPRSGPRRPHRPQRGRRRARGRRRRTLFAAPDVFADPLALWLPLLSSPLEQGLQFNRLISNRCLRFG